jgi:DNA-3-methyladenine glycosylase I
VKSIKHSDGLERCPWCGSDPLYVDYHDTEWGVPERDDRALFEKLLLDGFQAGLSWITILRKRDNFRRAFDGFVPEKIARYDKRKLASLMKDAGIIRNRMKIDGSVASARAYLEIMEKGPGFSKYLWEFVDGEPIVNQRKTIKQIPAESDVSRQISKDLKARGFKFCGPTIVYAFMQAVGMVNDHLVTCHCYGTLTKSRKRR